MSGRNLGKILMVSYYYPPIAAAGSHRIVNFARELSRLGWRVRVVGSSDFKRNPLDPGLLARAGESVRVVRAPSIDLVELLGRWKRAWGPKRKPGEEEFIRGGPMDEENGEEGRGVLDYLSRLLKIPDGMASFIPSAFFRALPAMIADRPDVIFSSGPPFSCHLAAFLLKHLFHVPWIADFRDPWADNPFRRRHPYTSLVTLNQALERKVVQSAERVVTNTPALESAFRTGYPHLDRFVTVTNGFDPALLGLFEDPASWGAGVEKSKFQLVHTGEVYGLRSPDRLISALASLRGAEERSASACSFHFFGNVHKEKQLSEQARSLGVEGAFCFHGPVGHAEAMRRASAADVLLLLGVKGDSPEIQVPSKLFEYLVLRRPILSLSKRGGAIEGILRRSGIPYLLADLEKEEEIRLALLRMARGEWDGGTSWEGLSEFGFDRLAQRLSRVLEDVVYCREAVPE